MDYTKEVNGIAYSYNISYLFCADEQPVKRNVHVGEGLVEVSTDTYY